MAAPRSLSKLINELSKLPGIGEKSATRLAFYILKAPLSYAQNLSSALLEMKNNIQLCSRCFHFTQESLCEFCRNDQRSGQILCIVEEPADLLAIESSKTFGGKYHVLHGAISPLEGIGPEQLKIKELLRRIQNEQPVEIILATNISVEGETTALYLTKLLKPLGLKLTRIAHGIPLGGDLKYMDSATIGNAIQNRTLMA
jgi:recombination protein RecR